MNLTLGSVVPLTMFFILLLFHLISMFVLWSPCARQEKVSFQENWRCIDAARFFSQNKERILLRFGGITSLQIRITNCARTSEWIQGWNLSEVSPTSIFAESLIFHASSVSHSFPPSLFVSRFSPIFLYFCTFPFLSLLSCPSLLSLLSLVKPRRPRSTFSLLLPDSLCSDLVAFITRTY